MGQNKAILGYFLANVHKRRNYNSCNVLDLHFGTDERSIFLHSQFEFFAFFALFSWQICAFFQTKLYFAWIKRLKSADFRALYIKSLIILVAILRILQKQYFEKWGI